MEEFDHLSTVAKNTQKEFLYLINPISSAEYNRRSRKKIIAPLPDTERVIKRRRRRKKVESPPGIDSTSVEDSDRPNQTATKAIQFGIPAPLNDIKLGQIIRDTELLKLILKAIKWNDNCLELERLRNTELRMILNNSNLMHDDDLIKLIKSYLGQDGNNNSYTPSPTGGGESRARALLPDLENDNSVTEMEVKVDPTLFFMDDDERERYGADGMETDDSRTISIDLNDHIDFIEDNEKVRKAYPNRVSLY